MESIYQALVERANQEKQERNLRNEACENKKSQKSVSTKNLFSYYGAASKTTKPGSSDFNAKLGFDVINHDMNPMSKNGEELFNLFCKYNLTLLNTLDFCEGTHTRIHKYKSRIEKSILDYVFVSSDLKKNVISMCIDEQKQFTPWRNLKSGKRFSDHCAIKFQLHSKVFVKEKHFKSTQVWNFNDPDGWEKFNKLTNSINMSESMWRASEHTELSYQSWKFNLNSILHRCFKKKR